MLVVFFLDFPFFGQVGVHIGATTAGDFETDFDYVARTVAGVGVGTLLDTGETFSVGAILSSEILAALTGLGLLALLPVVYQRYRTRSRAVVAVLERRSMT